MNATLSVQDLWSQILALPAADRHWLQDKLNVYEEEEEHQRYTSGYAVRKKTLPQAEPIRQRKCTAKCGNILIHYEQGRVV